MCSPIFMHNNTEKPVTQILLQGTELSDIVYIRDHAFQNCKSLKEFHHYFAKSITHFGKYVFADAAITYFDIEGVAFISGNYTWYKTEREVVDDGPDAPVPVREGFFDVVNIGRS